MGAHRSGMKCITQIHRFPALPCAHIYIICRNRPFQGPFWHFLLLFEGFLQIYGVKVDGRAGNQDILFLQLICDLWIPRTPLKAP